MSLRTLMRAFPSMPYKTKNKLKKNQSNTPPPPPSSKKQQHTTDWSHFSICYPYGSKYTGREEGAGAASAPLLTGMARSQSFRALLVTQTLNSHPTTPHLCPPLSTTPIHCSPLFTHVVHCMHLIPHPCLNSFLTSRSRQELFSTFLVHVNVFPNSKKDVYPFETITTERHFPSLTFL